MKEPRDAWVRDTAQAHASRGRQGLGCGRLGRRVSEKAGGNELQSAQRKRNRKNSFSYIAVEKKAVANDEERYMVKLAKLEVIPNKLEDTRFIFVGNYSPE
jgi:hypothetical protein